MKTRFWRQVSVAATVAVLCASSGYSAQWLRTAVDPTCAVIEKAEYDASSQSIRITGRSSEAVTLRVYDAKTNDTLLVAKRPETGKWTLTFDLVGTDTTPGMVVVQGISGCATFRLVTDDTFGLAPLNMEDNMVATLGDGAILSKNGPELY